MTKKKKWILLTFGIIIITFIISEFFLKSDKRILQFENEFGINLPKEPKILFSKYDYGAMGDGYRLYVYQLTSKDMSILINSNKTDSWSALPINQKMFEGLYEAIDGLSNSTIIHNIDLKSKNGYYIVKNRYGKPLKGYDFTDKSYYNIIIGIIDTEKNKIYFCTWDM